jgi:hypothetical protein
MLPGIGVSALAIVLFGAVQAVFFGFFFHLIEFYRIF